MKFCVSTVQMSMLVKGSPVGFFPTYQGLQQGDLLSPLLFILVMEAFSRLLSRAVHEGLLQGFSVGSSIGTAIGVSHSLYADDTLVFCDADMEQLGFLQCVLICFDAVSGLQINLSKSELIPVGEVERMPV